MRDLGAAVAAALGQASTGGSFAVSSLQLGLYCTLRGLGIGPGSVVACDPVFPFATLAALHMGAAVVHPRVVIHDAGYRLELCVRSADVALVACPFGWSLDEVIPGSSVPLIIDMAMAPFADVMCVGR